MAVPAHNDQCFLVREGALSGSRIPLNMGEKDPRRTWASDRLFRCSFPNRPGEDEHDAAIFIFKNQNLCYMYS